MSIKELGEKIIKATNLKSKIVNIPARKGDIKDSYGDWSFANKMFGYKSEYGMETGFKETVSWYEENKNYFN